MKYYSEVTEKFYDSKKECEEAEKAWAEALEKEAVEKKKAQEKLASLKLSYENACKLYEAEKDAIAKEMEEANNKYLKRLESARRTVETAKEALEKCEEEVSTNDKDEESDSLWLFKLLGLV